MSKRNRQRETATPSEQPPAGPTWPRAAKIAVSLLVTWHIFCVLAGPWAMPQQASPLAADSRRFAAPYVEALFLSNG